MIRNWYNQIPYPALKTSDLQYSIEKVSRDRNIEKWLQTKFVWRQYLKFQEKKKVTKPQFLTRFETFKAPESLYQKRCYVFWKFYIWATPWENVSSGVSGQARHKPSQLQRPTRILKFRIYKLDVSFCLDSEQQRRWSDCADAQADLRLCCSHMA